MHYMINKIKLIFSHYFFDAEHSYFVETNFLQCTVLMLKHGVRLL